MTLNDLVKAILARGHECQIVLDTQLVGLSTPKVRVWATVKIKGPKDSNWRPAGTLSLDTIKIYSYDPLPGYDGSILERAMTEGGA